MTNQALVDVSLSQVVLGRRIVLGTICLSVAPGEVVGLLGPNGVGKSTLLRAICGLIRYEGTVAVGEKEITALRGHERAAKIAYVPQDHDVAWPIRIADLVALGRTTGNAGLSRRLTLDDERAIHEAMQLMDIADLATRTMDALSGGEKSRVLVARALAQETPLLVADEPAAGLDPAHQINLMKTFRALAGDGRSVIVSMHDLGLAARWCTRLILLDKQGVVADGLPEMVLQPDNIARVYGVSAYLKTENEGLIVQPLDTLITASQGTRTGLCEK